MLLDGLTVGKGDVSPGKLYAVISKRIERVLIRTVRSTNLESTKSRACHQHLCQPHFRSSLFSCLQEGGSYQQRVLVEFLKEIQARAEEVIKSASRTNDLRPDGLIYYRIKVLFSFKYSLMGHMAED